MLLFFDSLQLVLSCDFFLFELDFSIDLLPNLVVKNLLLLRRHFCALGLLSSLQLSSHHLQLLVVGAFELFGDLTGQLCTDLALQLCANLMRHLFDQLLLDFFLHLPLDLLLSVRSHLLQKLISQVAMLQLV